MNNYKKQSAADIARGRFWPKRHYSLPFWALISAYVPNPSESGLLFSSSAFALTRGDSPRRQLAAATRIRDFVRTKTEGEV